MSDKIFTFQVGTEALDWKAIAGVDISKIIATTDMDKLSTLIQTIAFGDPGRTIDSYDSLLKVFQLSQLSMQYLLFVQDFLREERNRAIQEKEKEKDKRSDIKKDSASSIKKYNHLKDKYEALKELHRKDFLKQFPDPFTCGLCQKSFGLYESFVDHYARRHPGVPVPPKPSISNEKDDQIAILLTEISSLKEILAKERERREAETADYFREKEEMFGKTVQYEKKIKELEDIIANLKALLDVLNKEKEETAKEIEIQRKRLDHATQPVPTPKIEIEVEKEPEEKHLDEESSSIIDFSTRRIKPGFGRVLEEDCDDLFDFFMKKKVEFMERGLWEANRQYIIDKMNKMCERCGVDPNSKYLSDKSAIKAHDKLREIVVTRPHNPFHWKRSRVLKGFLRDKVKVEAIERYRGLPMTLEGIVGPNEYKKQRQQEMTEERRADRRERRRRVEETKKLMEQGFSISSVFEGIIDTEDEVREAFNFLMSDTTDSCHDDYAQATQNQYTLKQGLYTALSEEAKKKFGISLEQPKKPLPPNPKRSFALPDSSSEEEQERQGRSPSSSPSVIVSSHREEEEEEKREDSSLLMEGKELNVESSSELHHVVNHTQLTSGTLHSAARTSSR
ncbi:hypothetical protein ADUPG1_000242, partial [Aduncisulcus paluster]